MSTPRESARLRLLVLSSTYPRWAGDPEPGFVHELAKRLADPFDVMVIAPSAPGALREEDLEGVRVHRFRYAPRALETLVNDGGITTNLRRHRWKWLLVPGFVAALLFSLCRLVLRWRPGVVHAHWLLPQGLAATLASMVVPKFPPFVVTSHGADLYTLRGPMMRRLQRFVLRRARAATVVSHAMLDELRQLGADMAGVSVQPMGVDLAGRFVPDPAVDRTPGQILFVGRLVEKKGLRHLIDAMPVILEACPEASLLVIGFGPEESACRRQVQKLGLGTRVEFMGPVSQAALPGFYRRAAVLAAPFVQAVSGDREGLGLVMVEAAGCGCPVVASDLPAVRDVADGILVRTTQSGSVPALAAGIVDVLGAPPGDVEVSGSRAGLLARFDWAHVASGYERILRLSAS